MLYLCLSQFLKSLSLWGYLRVTEQRGGGGGRTRRFLSALHVAFITETSHVIVVERSILRDWKQYIQNEAEGLTWLLLAPTPKTLLSVPGPPLFSHCLSWPWHFWRPLLTVHALWLGGIPQRRCVCLSQGILSRCLVQTCFTNSGANFLQCQSNATRFTLSFPLLLRLHLVLFHCEGLGNHGW